MKRKTEHKHFDISHSTEAHFNHYQILVKIMNEEKTEHHSLEIFTAGPKKLLEMRRVYAKTHKRLEFTRLLNVLKNN